MFVVVAEQNEHYYGDYFILLQSFFIVISYKVLVFSPSPYGTLMTLIKKIFFIEPQSFIELLRVSQSFILVFSYKFLGFSF